MGASSLSASTCHRISGRPMAVANAPRSSRRRATSATFALLRTHTERKIGPLGPATFAFGLRKQGLGAARPLLHLLDDQIRVAFLRAHDAPLAVEPARGEVDPREPVGEEDESPVV